MSERLFHGLLRATISDVLDGTVDLLPHFELAAIPVLDAQERPAEVPTVRRRLRAEGIRVREHRGVLLLEPGDLDRVNALGLLSGNDEVLLVSEWNDEFEAFPGRFTSDLQDFSVGTPLGLEEWMLDSGCILAMGDGRGLNFATLDAGLAERLRKRFKVY
ncbi:MAG TPA: hypothetical protein VMJ70_06675 [Candidatus Sulfotelmatobacter sp.]|nr:hypothetical protein [Candidatus Sulfotelmatobacter sp.]